MGQTRRFLLKKSGHSGSPIPHLLGKLAIGRLVKNNSPVKSVYLLGIGNSTQYSGYAFNFASQ